MSKPRMAYFEIEILGASTFIRDSVLESVKASVLDLAEAKTG